MNGKSESIFALMSSAFLAFQSASSIPSAARASVARSPSAPYCSSACLHVMKMFLDLLIFWPSIWIIPLTLKPRGQCFRSKRAAWWNAKKVRWFGMSSFAEFLRSTGYQ